MLVGLKHYETTWTRRELMVRMCELEERLWKIVYLIWTPAVCQDCFPTDCMPRLYAWPAPGRFGSRCLAIQPLEGTVRCTATLHVTSNVQSLHVYMNCGHVNSLDPRTLETRCFVVSKRRGRNKTQCLQDEWMWCHSSSAHGKHPLP